MSGATRRRKLAGTLALLAGLAASCQAGAGDDAEGATDTEEMRDPVEPPNFLQPASGVLMLDANRVDDVRLSISGVQAATRLVIDGTNHGDLSATPWVGSLDSQQLVLRMGGALVSARHTMYLETPSVDEPARSEEIQINILVETVPAVSASLGPESSLTGAGILAQGMGEQSLLLVYEESDDAGPRVHAHRAAGSGWDFDDTVTVATPRLERVDGVLPLSAALETMGTESKSDDRLRLAWRTSSTLVEYVDRPWTGTPTAPRPALALEQLDVEAFEFASLGAPTVVGNTIFVETNLLTDTEAPRPGDHRLSVVPLAGSPAEAGTPRLTAPLGVVDIDHLGPALDFASLAVEPQLRPQWIAARVQGARGAVFEVDPNSGTLRLHGMNLALGGWQDTRLPVAAVLGAFGSRTMFGVAGGNATVQAIDDSGEAAAEDASASLLGGGTAQDAGRPALTMLDGHPVMLLPMGSEHPVQALTVGGARVNSHTIDLLRCEEIAVPAVAEAATGMSVQFACRGGNEIRVGTLALVP